MSREDSAPQLQSVKKLDPPGYTEVDVKVKPSSSSRSVSFLFCCFTPPQRSG